ncbi:hypothetical protein OIU84_017139 [Salix udensis]|uniref:Leucine-rich repeat-containing N-terminal plant-type domain-containing protein n=1 Tax=Salix udensis TaxID=889485 RepID=A0AAD6L195_9ROSI|nr:hypothetical protein OIU84_017139 [Salix udensis]
MGFSPLSLYPSLSFILFLFHFHSTLSSSPPPLCAHHQSLSLLQFKQSFSIQAIPWEILIQYPKTESWKEGTDCCFWDGVTCDLQTGLVTGLDLSSSMLHGTLHSNNSLFSLHHLRKLDLSFNNFTTSHISSRFGQFSNLTHLILTFSSFEGQVPSEISHLSKLVSLDLSWNSYSSLEPISFDKIARNLTKLRELDLSFVDMSLVVPDSLMNLSSSLSSLRLKDPEPISFYKSVQNLTMLRELALDSVNMSLVAPNSLTNLSSSLSSLSLRGCGLQGKFPGNIFLLPNLEALYLSDNEGLTGSFPSSNLSNVDSMVNPVAADDGPSQRHGWLEGIAIQIDNLSPVSNWSIWKVPHSLRAVNDDAYNPRIISIGPLRRGERMLQSMEIHKLYYMRSLLQRTPDSKETLESAAKAIEKFEEKIRACYAEPIHMGPSELAETLLVDGCFVLELFIRYSKADLRVQDDPLFYSSWMIFTLHLPELALGFFKSILYLNNENFRILRRPYPHLLDLIHNCYLPAATAVRNNTREWVSAQPATSLDAAGIKFRKRTARNLFDLKFRHGVLEIPPLLIHDSTVSLFQNLIAYEQLSRGTPQYITSYFALMSRIVYDRRDAELLESKGIIENEMSGWKDVSVLFNDMCKQVVIQDFYYAELCQNLNSNFWTQWVINKATLIKTYFKSPWAYVSIMAGFALLSLTAIQTIYAVLSYSRT